MSADTTIVITCDRCHRQASTQNWGPKTVVGARRAVHTHLGWIGQTIGNGEYSADSKGTDLCPPCYHHYHHDKGIDYMAGCPVCKETDSQQPALGGLE